MFDCCRSALKVSKKAVNLARWISVKDQEPPKGQPVLITDGKVIVVSFWTIQHTGTVEYLWEGYGFGLEDPMGWEWTFKNYEITHWMPLPALPGKEVITNDGKRKGRRET